MLLQYLSLPLSLDTVMQRTERVPLAKCELTESVRQHLRLLFTTSFGELPGNPDFGCLIWDHDFDNNSNGYAAKELFRKSLTVAIEKYEPRIQQVRVDIGIRQETVEIADKRLMMKKRVYITVTAVFATTNEKFTFNHDFFIGPLSFTTPGSNAGNKSAYKG